MISKLLKAICFSAAVVVLLDLLVACVVFSADIGSRPTLHTSDSEQFTSLSVLSRWQLGVLSTVAIGCYGLSSVLKKKGL